MSRYTLYNKNISRLTAILLVLMLLLPLAPAVSAAELSGTCGENLSWSYDAGTLTITGSGEMYDYSEQFPAPWNSFREKILWLELPNGLTSVGNMAFYDCSALTAIVLPGTVTRVGDLAFCQCGSATILSLNNGLKEIGANAFEQCRRIQSLRLPETLERIGSEAFYRCTALQYVTVPERTTNLGVGIFAYCQGLLRAEILAPVSELPQWTFYNCTSLTSIALAAQTKKVGSYSLYDCVSLDVVYYGGEPGDAEALKQQITEERESFAALGEVTTEKPQNSESGVQISDNEKGELIVEDTYVSQTENTTISTTIGTNTADPEDNTIPSKIIASIYSDAGWEELCAAIEKLGTDRTIYITVYVIGNGQIPRDVVRDLAGKNIFMTVITQTGASYVLDFAGMRKPDLEKTLDLSYVLTRLEETKHEILANVTAYELRFNGSGSIDAQVLIRLPGDNARRTVTLFYEKGGELVQVQSVVADEEAVARFYMGAIDKKTVYYLAIDLPGVAVEDAIVPDSLKQEFGITEQIQNVDYVITGRKSSWNIGFVELNKILVGFMLSTTSIVGLLMYALNKRKIRKGYTPGWDDEVE